MHTFLLVAAVVCLVIAGARTLGATLRALKIVLKGDGEVLINFVALLWVALGVTLLELAHYVH
jgi:ubiquinone biosynthesis protein UbiJ